MLQRRFLFFIFVMVIRCSLESIGERNAASDSPAYVHKDVRNSYQCNNLCLAYSCVFYNYDVVKRTCQLVLDGSIVNEDMSSVDRTRGPSYCNLSTCRKSEVCANFGNADHLCLPIDPKVTQNKDSNTDDSPGNLF